MQHDDLLSWSIINEVTSFITDHYNRMWDLGTSDGLENGGV